MHTTNKGNECLPGCYLIHIQTAYTADDFCIYIVQGLSAFLCCKSAEKGEENVI